jgi:hypothetical protein
MTGWRRSLLGGLETALHGHASRLGPHAHTNETRCAVEVHMTFYSAAADVDPCSDPDPYCWVVDQGKRGVSLASNRILMMPDTTQPAVPVVPDPSQRTSHNTPNPWPQTSILSRSHESRCAVMDRDRDSGLGTDPASRSCGLERLLQTSSAGVGSG